MLRFRLREDGLICRVNDVEGVPEEQDLAVRAARMLRAETGARPGVDIELRKRIPVGGGLGGGSSDAATTLLVLDRLWNTGLGPDRLRDLGAVLGADVPFFLFGESAWVEGVGERLRAIPLPPAWYVVLVPPVHVPTPLVFRAPELTRNTEALKMEDFSADPRDKRFRNDLEPVVAKRFPEVGEHLEWLARRAPARVTGSGGCVFAGFDSAEAAAGVLDELPAGMKGFVARGMDKHPLRG